MAVSMYMVWETTILFNSIWLYGFMDRFCIIRMMAWTVGDVLIGLCRWHSDYWVFSEGGKINHYNFAVFHGKELGQFGFLFRCCHIKITRMALVISEAVHYWYLTENKQDYGKNSSHTHDYIAYIIYHFWNSLQYMLLTWPNIAFSVNKVCQFLHSPNDEHGKAVKRILRYLCGTTELGLLFSASSNFVLNAYSNADLASCLYDLISWAARKQKIIAHLSTEAEYRTVAGTTSKLVLLRFLLFEIGIPHYAAPRLWCENVGVVYLTANPVFHAKMKHIEVDFHFVCDMVWRGHLDVKFVSSNDQIVDIFTKPLPKDYFNQLRLKLPLQCKLAGGC